MYTHPYTTHLLLSEHTKVKKNMIDVNVKWSPYVIKPNTEYTINGTVTVRKYT